MKVRFALLLILMNGSRLWGTSAGAAFLKIQTSVRAKALGGATVAAQGAQALGENPALLAPLRSKSELDASFVQLWEDSTNVNLAYTNALSLRTAWGVSTTYSDFGSSEERDSSGQATGQKNATHHGIASAALSKTITPGLRWGITGRVFQSTLADQPSDIAGSVDLGAAAQSKKFLFSASVHQLGPGIKYIDQQDALPSALRLDAAWETKPFSIMIGFHSSLTEGGSDGVLGVEYRLKAMALRAGMRTELSGEEDLAMAAQSKANEMLNDVTMGFGLTLYRNLRMDYAFSQNAPDWGPAHSLALTWAWGDPPLPPKPPKKLNKSPWSKPVKPPSKTKPPRRLKL